MLKRVTVVAAILLAQVAWGQTVPARGARAGVPRDVNAALQTPLRVDAQDMPLEKVMSSLQDMTQTNMVVNWNALAKAGITKSTPVTLHLKDVGYEYVIQTLMEVLPANGTRVNYVVGDNTLEVTTNAGLAVEMASSLYPVALATTYTLGTSITAEEQAKNAQLLEKVLRTELVRAGEPLEAKGRELVIRSAPPPPMLVATVSERGQTLIKRALSMFNAPIKIGMLASGTQLTAPAKRAQDAYRAFRTGPGSATLVEMAKEPEKFGQFNMALLPGAAQELAKAAPETPNLEMAINDGGVLLIGPKEAIRRRTSLGVYDLRDLIKRLNAKNKIKPQPTAAEYQAAIVQVVQSVLKPDGDGVWGKAEDLGQATSVLVPYNGLLIIFATAETHRSVTGALQDMNK